MSKLKVAAKSKNLLIYLSSTHFVPHSHLVFVLFLSFFSVDFHFSFLDQCLSVLNSNSPYDNFFIFFYLSHTTIDKTDFRRKKKNEKRVDKTCLIY